GRETAVELEVVTALRILRGAGERLEVLGADLLLQHVAQRPWARGGGDRVARPQRAEGEEVPREAQLPHPDPASVEAGQPRAGGCAGGDPAQIRGVGAAEEHRG